MKSSSLSRSTNCCVSLPESCDVGLYPDNGLATSDLKLLVGVISMDSATATGRWWWETTAAEAAEASVSYIGLKKPVPLSCCNSVSVVCNVSYVTKWCVMRKSIMRIAVGLLARPVPVTAAKTASTTHQLVLQLVMHLPELLTCAQVLCAQVKYYVIKVLHTRISCSTKSLVF